MNDNPLGTTYQQFIHKSRYARWLDSEGRRENWDETVQRLVSYYGKQANWTGTIADWDELYEAIYNLDIMPSMRAMMTAGPALDRCHVAAYNCAYLPVDSPRSFDETMYILMCGTGVGFSVESQYIDQLPKISEEFSETDTVIKVKDSKEGWAKSLRELISLLIAGQIPSWDTSNVRPAGARLKTFGGRASGPEPLEELFKKCVDTFKNAAGRRLTSIECHDIMMEIAATVIVGGVRRSAMISLFDVTDDRMNKAKHGAWWEHAGNRSFANNSAVYDHRRPDVGYFMGKWKELYDSKSGEPGLFSRYACQAIAERNGRRDSSHDFGTNPCSEIILRPFEFCNLTEVVVRPSDTLDTLKRKVYLASILGTIQSTLTDFKYLRKKWKDNCDEERLLGVSLTGVCDNLDVLTSDGNLSTLRDEAIKANEHMADVLGIARSAAITCVKPSGTVSQLVDSASGLHARHSPYYLRTIRSDNKDPVTALLKDKGVYNEPEVNKPDSVTVFYFAVKAPEGAVVRDDMSAIDMLNLWEKLQDEWCEHKPSATINVKDDEWMDVAAWVYRKFDKLSGVSFLPYDGGSYKQAPFQAITEEEYHKWNEEHPAVEIDWDDLKAYEDDDNTTGSQEFACVGNSCEINI